MLGYIVYWVDPQGVGTAGKGPADVKHRTKLNLSPLFSI